MVTVTDTIDQRTLKFYQLGFRMFVSKRLKQKSWAIKLNRQAYTKLGRVSVINLT